MYPATIGYGLTGTLPGSSYYDYTGTIYYNYTTRPDPYVKATAANDMPTAQFTGSDITVKVTGNGTVNNLTDTNAIDYWNIWSKVSWDGGVTYDDSTAIKTTVSGSNTTASGTLTFTIPASKISAALASSSSYKVAFKVTPIVVLKDGKTTYQDTAYTYSTFSSTPPTPPSSPAPPPQPCQAPVAVASAPSKLAVGETCRIDASGSHATASGATIKSYSFNQTDLDFNGLGPTSYKDVSFSQTGSYTYYINAVDSNSCYASTSVTINVTPPYPTAAINFAGTTKENRKVTLDGSGSSSPSVAPITAYAWQITPLSGGTATDIKYSGALTNAQQDILIKKAGTYQVTLTVTNAQGYTDTKTKTLTIDADLAPIAYFQTINTVYRDPANGDRAHIQLNDMSYSPDGDSISQRVWTYAYDSNNDGSFAGETWYTLDATNQTKIDFYPTQVGKYKFELQVTEAFGQPTIPAFVTSADTRTANTWQ